MRVIAFDPSTRSTGVCVLDDSLPAGHPPPPGNYSESIGDLAFFGPRPKIVWAGTISQSGKCVVEKITHTVCEAEAVMVAHSTDETVVVAESPYHGPNAQTFGKLSGVYYGILGNAIAHGHKYLSVTAPEVKQLLAEKARFRRHGFALACAQNDIDHRLTKPNHP